MAFSHTEIVAGVKGETIWDSKEAQELLAAEVELLQKRLAESLAKEKEKGEKQRIWTEVVRQYLGRLEPYS